MSIEFDHVIIKNRRVRFFLWIIFPVLILLSIIVMSISGVDNIGGTVLLVGLAGLLLTFFTASRFYNWTICLFCCVFIGLWFKSQHWPLSGAIMGSATLLLTIVTLYNSIMLLRTFLTNSFLKWFGGITGLIIVLFMTGFLMMNMYWPGKQVFIFLGCILFVFTVLAMVFTMPNSNYVSWSILERKVFFRLVLMPMAFIFVLFTLVFVFTDVYNSLMHRGYNIAPWSWVEIELRDLEGIPLN